MTPASRLRLAFVGLALAWAALILVTPAWVARATPGAIDGRTLTAALVRAVGARICHQRPERSFHLRGQPLPVCGRCTGLYVSGAAGLLFAGLGRRGRRRPVRVASGRWWPGRLDPRAAWLAAAALPTALTWGLEVAGVWNPGTAIRCLAALPLGAVAAWLAGRALDGRVDAAGADVPVRT